MTHFLNFPISRTVVVFIWVLWEMRVAYMHYIGAFVYLCICVFLYLCIFVFVSLCICAFVYCEKWEKLKCTMQLHLCICAFVHLCTCVFVYLYICVLKWEWLKCTLQLHPQIRKDPYRLEPGLLRYAQGGFISGRLFAIQSPYTPPLTSTVD